MGDFGRLPGPPELDPPPTPHWELDPPDLNAARHYTGHACIAANGVPWAAY